jgi:hypothetical protein
MKYEIILYLILEREARYAPEGRVARGIVAEPPKGEMRSAPSRTMVRQCACMSPKVMERIARPERSEGLAQIISPIYPN